MKVEWHSNWLWQIAFLGAFLLAISPAQAEGSQAGAATRETQTKTVASRNGGRKTAEAPMQSALNRVSVLRAGQQVEVRIEGQGRLVYVPFRLADPERLVLDFLGTLTRVPEKLIPSNLQPVRGIRVGQFTDAMARVVIDLDGQVSYSIRVNGNVVSVLLGSPAGEASGVTAKHEQNRSSIASAQPDRVAPQSAPGLSGINTRRMTPPESLAQRTAVQTPVQTSAKVQTEPPASAPAEAIPAREQPTSRAVSAPVKEQPAKRPAEVLSVPPMEDYVIGPQDVIAVNVWREPELSRAIPVRPDGKISLPLVGDLMASGLTPRMLQARITKELEIYLHKPQVTVIIQEANSHKFYIIGEVERPGAFGLATRMTVLDALAAAGGFRDFAKVTQIYLLRRMPDGSRKRIAFNFKAAVNGMDPYRDLELLPGDTIVVP